MVHGVLMLILPLGDEQIIICDLEEVSLQHLHTFHVAKNYNLRCIFVDLLLNVRLTWEEKQRICEMCVYKSHFSPSRMFAS